MKRILAALFLILAATGLSAQFTLTTSNTVQMSGATKPWIDMADPTCFGNGQIFKSLFFCDGGDLPQLYNQNSWTVSTGSTGGTPTTTSIPTSATGGSGTTTSYSVTSNTVTLNGTFTGLAGGEFVQFSGFTSATFLNGGSAFLSSASGTTLTFGWATANIGSTAETGSVNLGYPAGYFVGATIVVKNVATGATRGTATVTASTATTATHGPVFTPSPALSSAPVNGDVAIVMLRSPSQLMTPMQLYGRVGASVNTACSGMVFNPNDKDPLSTNTTQSLELPTGCTLTLFADQQQRNATNPNPTLAAQQVPNININGAYMQSIRVKCGAASGSGSFTYSVVRGSSTYVSNHNVTPACTNSSGSGWALLSNPFTGSETGSQTGNVAYTLNCISGPCRLQDIDVVEGSTLPGNTSPVRDDVIRTLQGQASVLQGLLPGGLRWMAPPQWGTYQAEQWQPANNRQWSNISNFIPFSMEAAMGYDDMLAVCDVVNVDCYMSIGMFNTGSDWASFITTLSTNSHYLSLKSHGHGVYPAFGNEAFNSAAGGSLFEGDGVLYGSWFAPGFLAARAASGFDATHMHLTANSWFAPGQSDGPFGWLAQMLKTAFNALGSNALPEFVEIAPYNFPNLNNCSTANVPCLTSGLSTTGEPWTGLFSQIPSYDAVLPRPSGEGSVIASVQAPATLGSQYAATKTLVYEINSGMVSGLAASQDQVDSVAAGAGEAVALGEHWEMMQGVSGLQGPIGTFLLTEGFNGQNCSGSGCPSNVVSPVWGVMRTMPCGPGQMNTSCLPQFRPQGVYMQVLDAAIGGNSNLMSSTMSCTGGLGTCFYSYPGGQPSGSTNTIPANTQTNFVNCFVRSDLSSTGMISCYNIDSGSSHTVTVSGPLTPPGAVTGTLFPKAGNTVASHNEASYVATLGTAAVVTLPPTSSLTGPTFTVAPASSLTLPFPTGTPTLAAPTFSPVAGTYSSTQTVALGCAAGATCVFTTDGSTPTAAPPGTPTHGTVYTGPITVSSSLTINAIATQVGFFNSSVASAPYVIAPPAATPTFSPVAGTYTSIQTVTISDTTPSPTIHFTTDGSTPTLASPTYTGPITVAVTQTVNAIAIASGFSVSPVGTAHYIINLPVAAAPTFSPVAGTYPTAQSVSLATTTSAGLICYKIGSAPSATTPGACDAGSIPYSTAISVTTSQTIFALTTKVGLTNSGVVSAAYVIEVPAATPTFSPAAGTYTSVQTVSILDSTPSASIFYTINGTTPTPSSTPYTGPITVSSTTTIKAIVTAPGFLNSAVGTAVYTLTLPPAATPTFAPPAGIYTSIQSVVITSATPSALIFYTTDGSTPTPSSTPYTGPVTVSTSQTIKAIATKVGFSGSAVGSATYTINLPLVATPTFAPPGGPYSSSQSVTISDTTVGASIFYTTDGSTPTPSSTLYTGPITVSTSQTIQAIGVLSGFSNSLVGSAAYTITSVSPGCSITGTVTFHGTVTLVCPQ